MLAEDTRHTRGLLERHGITARLLSYHEHNEAARVAELLPRLAGGRADGARLRRGPAGDLRPGRAARARGARRGRAGDGAAGASAVETALVASGLVGGRYAFVGFLPRKAGELEALWRELAAGRWPVVAFESPQRLPASLRSLAAVDAASARSPSAAS